MAWREAERGWDDPVRDAGTIDGMFATAVRRHADSPAQSYKGGVYDRSLVPDIVSPGPDGEYLSLSYETVGSIVRHLAAGFRSLGVGPGDRVGLFAETRMEWAQVDFAVLAAGGVVVPVYADASADQAGHLLADSDATGVVVGNAAGLDTIADAEAEPGTDLDLEFAVTIDEVPAEPTAALSTDVLTLGELHERGRDHASGESGLQSGREPDQLASLVYTSGTTGRPKGVPLTHANLKSNVDQCRARFGPRPDKEGPAIGSDARTVSFLPLAHIFERLAGHYVMFASGATVSYAESAETLQSDFATVQPNVATSVPRVYEKLYETIRDRASGSELESRFFEWASDVARAYAATESPGWWLEARRRLADRLVFSSIREALGGEIDFLISGGGSLAADLCRFYHGIGVPVFEGYGLTETGPVVSVNPPEAPRIGSVGPPLIDVEVDVDETKAPGHAEGTVGELLVRGPNVASGYWNRPADTAEAFTDEGWFRTGDIVELDGEGYLRFRERAGHLLVLSTGKNVAPGPIEDAFTPTDLVTQCVVLGDDRKFVAALLVPNVDAIEAWAKAEGIDLPADRESLVSDDRVVARIGELVEEVNRSFEPHERIKQFRLIPREFTTENGLLTPTLSKRRREITRTYADEIEELYRRTPEER